MTPLLGLYPLNVGENEPFLKLAVLFLEVLVDSYNRTTFDRVLNVLQKR